VKLLHRQRGIALLVAIIMFALATTVAAAITYNKAMASRRAAATFTLEQALQAGMAAEALAAIALESNGTANRTALHQEWHQIVGPLEIEGTGVWIQAQLEDLSGRFNLNSLVMWSQQDNSFVEDPHQVQVFKHLLGFLGMEVKWAGLMKDWIDPDIAPDMTSGGEDTLYLTQTPPYRPPNTFITHASELLALPGFGPENYAKLAPYVTAIPRDAKVNICTASGYVLDATRNDPQNLTEFQTQDLETLREKDCFPVKAAYADPIGDPQLKQLVEGHIDEKSSWFRLRTQIRVGTAEFVLYSVLFREQTNKVRTLQRSFGSE
jgi:general secretion pathway protein K